ncbi:MAG: hypothetical protein R2856_38195 [Caldilineaceae bacterium]
MGLLREYRALGWLLLCLAICLGLLFAPVFVQGEVIVPGDIPYTNAFWAADPGATQFSPLKNGLLSDQINQFFVWHSLASDAMQNGRGLPLWNPYVFTGQPLVGNAQSALFYPPNLLLRWFSPGSVASLRGLFNIIVAAIFTFLFTRSLQVSARGSIFAAIAFAFSGPLIVWLGHPHSNVLATLPLVLWAVEMTVHRPQIREIAVLGIGVGLSFLGGHPETTFHVLAFAFVYGGLRLVFLRPGIKAMAARTGGLLAGSLLGLGVAAIQVLPFAISIAEFNAGRWRPVDGRLELAHSSEWLPNLASGVTAIFPNFFGNPVTNNYNWPFANFQNYNEQSIYFGVLPWAMMLGVLLFRPRKVVVWIVLGLALVALAVAWRLPGFELVNHLPLFSISLNKRLKMIFVLFAAVASGFGFDAFLAALNAKDRNRGLFLGIAVARRWRW